MTVPDRGQGFVQNSYLTYLVPFSTDFKLEKALEGSGEAPQSFFESIEDRESLFFGWWHLRPSYGQRACSYVDTR